MKVWFVYFVLPVGAVFVAICALAIATQGPCHSFWTGDITGQQVFKGEHIQCYRGDVVAVEP